MIDTLEALAPAPYRVADRKEWIVCEEAGLEGFAVLVRVSMTNAEQRELRKRVDYIEGEYTKQWFEKPADERDNDSPETPRALQRQLLAPHIYDWNAEGFDVEAGEWRKIPPPAVAGYEAFDAIEAAHMSWIVDIILGGYYALGKAGTWRKLSPPTGSTSEAKRPDADLPPPVDLATGKRRRPKS